MARPGTLRHRDDVRRDVFEGKGLPSRQEQDAISEQRDVVDQVLSVPVAWQDRQKRAVEMLGDTGQHDGAQLGRNNQAPGEFGNEVGLKLIEKAGKRRRHGAARLPQSDDCSNRFGVVGFGSPAGCCFGSCVGDADRERGRVARPNPRDPKPKTQDPEPPSDTRCSRGSEGAAVLLEVVPG